MLEISNINFKIKNKIILNDISFKCKKGDVIAFIGNNGAGKTTTIKAIFKEVNINSGEIKYDGKKINRDGYKKICFFPDSNNVPLFLTSSEYIKYNAKVIGIKEGEIKSRLKEVTKLLKLEEFLNTKIKDLSAGWKKTIIMAAVLIKKPEYIIFDEPTANLDLKAKEIFYDVFKFFIKNGVSLIITSHLLDDLQFIANHLIILDNGKIKYNNTFDKEKEKILDIYNERVLKNIAKTEIDLEFYKKNEV